jgi:GNAT superfamily N-acetyltransferase
MGRDVRSLGRQPCFSSQGNRVVTDAQDGRRRLERLGFRARPSFETVEVDGWTLRFADGYTKRANSVNPHFGSTLPVSAKIAHCEALYGERGLPTIFRLTPFSEPADLDRALAAAGYDVLDRSLVMEASLDRAPDLESGNVLGVPAGEWFSAFDRLCPLDRVKQAAHRRIVESAQGTRCFALIEQNGDPIVCGLGVLVDAAVGLFDLYTAEEHRRRGHGAAVIGSILRWAAHQGARTAFLQVHSQNTPARRLYERFGFEVAYPYWYRIKT